MITTGAQLSTFITGLNAEATIDPTLLDVLVDTARATIEEERPWGVLRKTDTSLSVTTAGTWQTAKSLSGITDFSRFFGDFAVRIFDGGNRVEYYRQVPWDRRLEYKDISNTFVYDENSGNIYLNGTIPFNGTLYLNYVATSTPVDLTAATAVWQPFPARFLPLLGYYAIGIFKGAVDYDSINRDMLPTNAAAMTALKEAMISWDNERVQSSLEFNDPSEPAGGGYPRSGAINRDGDGYL